jgi:hypothetical protein
MTIHQGHKYRHGVREVIALQTRTDDELSANSTVRVQAIDHRHPSGLGRAFNTYARYLVPAPMRYFQGQAYAYGEGA